MDWRREDDYRFTERLDPQGWAWEFLRRNSRYRREFEAELEAFQALPSKGPMGWIPDDPLDPDFLIPHYRDPRNVYRWHLSAFFNPAQDKPRRLYFLPPGRHATSVQWGVPVDPELDPDDANFIREERKVELDLRPGEVAAVLDLSIPLDRQLKVVKRSLKWHQNWFEKELKVLRVQRPKLHRRLWARYLRLLDADDEGIGPKEIADQSDFTEESGDDEQKVWDQLEAAKKLTKPEGYLMMLTASR